MKIEKITKKNNKYKITLDDGKHIYTYDEVILQNGLLYHKYINEKLLKKIYSDTEYYKCYNKALDMISRRLRSEFEMRNYFKKNEIKEDDIESIIDNLKRIGLIDDLNYAKAYTNDRVNIYKDGPYKIRKHLEESNIDKEITCEVINNINENILNNHIDKIIEKKIKNNKKYPPIALKQKIITYLINLGYSKDSIIKRLNNYKIESVNLKSEMDKVFNKLKRKYSGKDLEYRLKTKLYTKGFTKSEIEEYMKNSSLI